MRTSTQILAVIPLLSGSLAAQNVSSIAFDGADDYADGGTSSVFEITTALTLEAWVKVDPTQTNPYPRIIDKFDVVAGTGYNLISNSGHLFMEIFYAGGGGDSYGVYGNAINDGLWHHVAGVFSGNALQLYIDGLPDIGATGPTVTIIPSANNLGIGNNYDGQNYLPLNGKIDEVRIWNVARSAAEILAYKDSCLAGSEAGLVGYWRLDENAGATAYDLTTNGNDLTLGNGAAWSTDVAYPSLGDCATSGITQFERGSSLTVAPNPLSGEGDLTLSGIEKGTCQIVIQDLLGRVRMKTAAILPGSIDLDETHIDAGGYVLTVITPSGDHISTRLVVM